MSTDLRIREALHDLADGPEPADLADRALLAAGRRRQTRITASAAGATVAVLLGITAAVQVNGNSVPQPVEPSTVSCERWRDRTDVVDRAEWPDILTAVVEALPAGFEYSMATGYAWCGHPSDAPRSTIADASLSISVGPDRPGGLNVNVYVTRPPTGVATTCAELSASMPWPPLFCDDPTPTAPLAVGVSSTLLIATYADGTVIVMQTHAGTLTGTPPITAEELRSVVADPDVRAAIPSAEAIRNQG